MRDIYLSFKLKMRTPGTLGLGEKARHLERYISLWDFSLSLLKSESDSNIVFIAVFVLFFLMLDEGSWPKVAAKYFKFTTSL